MYGDTNAVAPGGVRLGKCHIVVVLYSYCTGAPALTSRGFVEKDFDQVAEYLDRVVKICVAVQVRIQCLIMDRKQFFVVVKIHAYTSTRKTLYSEEFSIT